VATELVGIAAIWTFRRILAVQRLLPAWQHLEYCWDAAVNVTHVSYLFWSHDPAPWRRVSQDGLQSHQTQVNVHTHHVSFKAVLVLAKLAARGAKVHEQLIKRLGRQACCF
jgi:hypothetical protein